MEKEIRVSGPMEKTINFCIEKGLLPDKTLKNCLSCGAVGTVMWISDVSKSFPHRLRCRICRTSTSPKHNTWFRECRLYPWQVLNITYNFLAKAPRATAAEEGEATSATILEWYNYCREVCYICVNHDVKQIGGKGHVVEVEELNLKSNKSVEDLMLVVGVDRDTQDCFISEVVDRTPETLFSVIYKWVLPETSVVSKHWPLLQEIIGSKDVSEVEQNLIEFVPTNNTLYSTLNVLKVLETLKATIKKEGRLSRSECLLHVGEFVYRQKKIVEKLLTAGELFLPFLDDISRVYPGYGKTGIGNNFKESRMKLLERL